MKKEYAIGEVFEFQNEKYVMVEDSFQRCLPSCAFYNDFECPQISNCAPIYRKDGKYAHIEKYTGEHKMKKPIFENEKAFTDSMTDIGYFVIPERIKSAKEKGYIKKSALEEAEELYIKYNPNDDNFAEHHILIETMHEAIGELKEQLEEKK